MATVTKASTAYGGGFVNVGCYAPPGVGHDWYACGYGDVFGIAVSNDAVTWRPTNKGIGGPHATRHTLRGSAIEGSRTVANRIYGWSGHSNDGLSGGGTIIRGTYSTATGFITWTNFAQTTAGVAGGTTSYGHPRQVGRLLELDEANDTLYVGTVNGVARVTISTGAVTEARALAGEDITGILLDPANPQIMWATSRSTSPNPGVYRIANVRSGTVASTRYAVLTNPTDLALVDTGTTRYLFVAAMAQGVRRWTVSADITTGWNDITANYNTGGTGNGPASLDAFYDGTQAQVLVVNAGNNTLTNGGGYTRVGLNATPTWVNETSNWTVNMVPWAEVDPWWLSVLIPGLMLNGTGYDSACARIDPNNTNRATLWGRSGPWHSQNGWQTWRPNVKGTVGVMSWVIAARPGFANQVLMDGGDWSVLLTQDPLTATTEPVRPRPGGSMGLMWTDDGAEAAWSCGDPFAGASEAGVFVSTNGGTSWVDQNLPVGVDAHGVAIGYNASGQRVLMTVKGGGIQRKVGTGGWSQVSTLTVPQDSQAHNQHFCWPQNRNNATGGRREFVYCTGHNGLLRSDDWGATWTTIHAKTNTGESAGSIGYDPATPNTLYYTIDNGVAGDTGLWKITNASTSPTATRIGPTMTAPGPCAVDPNTGVVYVCTTALESGGAKLYASPANNPGAATTFVDITDTQWEHGPWAPCDMTVTEGGQIVVANRQGGIFVATRDTATTPTVVTATATSGFSLGGTGEAVVVAAAPGDPGGLNPRVLADATATANSASTISVTPTGMVEGDWMLAGLAAAGALGAHSAPTGWVQVFAESVTSGLGLSVWRKQAGAAEAGPYVFGVGSSGRRIDIGIVAWEGADPDTPVETSNSAATTNVASFTHPALQVGGEGRVWLAWTVKNTAAGVATTLNTPDGWTEVFDLCTTNATLVNANLALHYLPQPGAVAVDTFGDTYHDIYGPAVTSTSADVYEDIYDDIYGSVTTAATGPVTVTSPDTSTARSWVGGSLLLQPPSAGVTVVTATATSGFSLGGAAVASVVGGITPPPPAPGVTPADEPWFNGSWWPKVHLLLSIGDAAAVGSAAFRFDDATHGFDRGIFAGGAQVDLARHIRSVAIGARGRDTPIDSANPCPATIVLNNGSTGGNGDYDPDNPLSPYYPDFVEGMGVEVVAERPIGTFWRRYVGKVSSISLDAGLDPTVTLTCADALEGFGRAQLPVQNIPVGGGERSGQRIARILDAARHPTSQRSLDTGYSIVAPTTLGDSALELLRQVEMTEFGLLFVDGAGTVVFYDRHRAATATRSTTVQARITDTAGPGEPAMVELTLDWSRDRIYNDVHVTRQPVPNPPVTHPEDQEADDTPVEQVAGDFTSQDIRGILSLPAAVGELLVDDYAAAEMAQGLVLRFASAAPARIRQVSVNALARDLWDVLLPLGLLDRIYVRRDYGPRVIAVELLIQAMTETITADPPGWELEFTTAEPPPTPTFWRFDSSTFGVGRFGW